MSDKILEWNIKLFNKQWKQRKHSMGLNSREIDNSTAAKINQNEICIHVHKIWKLRWIKLVPLYKLDNAS